MRLKLKLKIPALESILLFYYITFTIWKDLIFSKLPGGTTLSVIVLIFLWICTLQIQNKHLVEYIDVFALYIFLFFLFFFKFWENSEMSPWIDRTYGLISVITWGGIYGYAVIRVQRNYNRTLDCLKKAGILLLIYYAWQSLEVFRTGYWTYEQFGIIRQTTSNMSWSYGILAAMCFLSIYYFREKKRWMIIIFAICTIGILMYGSRGTLLAVAFGVLLCVLFYHQEKMPKKNYVILFILIGLGIFLISDKGVALISDFLSSRGISSRFIDSLLNYTTFAETSNGRMRIWSTVFDLISTGPFYGYGVFAERNVVYNLGMKWGYSHNIFLEILADFGWLIGSFIIIYLVFWLVRFFKDTKKEKDERLLFVIFLTISFELVLSNSIWLHYGLWILMGLCVNHFKRKRYLLRGEKR